MSSGSKLTNHKIYQLPKKTQTTLPKPKEDPTRTDRWPARVGKLVARPGRKRRDPDGANLPNRPPGRAGNGPRLKESRLGLPLDGRRPWLRIHLANQAGCSFASGRKIWHCARAGARGDRRGRLHRPGWTRTSFAGADAAGTISRNRNFRRFRGRAFRRNRGHAGGVRSDELRWAMRAHGGCPWTNRSSSRLPLD